MKAWHLFKWEFSRVQLRDTAIMYEFQVEMVQDKSLDWCQLHF